MVSRKEFFIEATARTVSFLRTTFSDSPDHSSPADAAPHATDDLLYEAMALGIDPGTVDASQLPDLVARARAAIAP